MKKIYLLSVLLGVLLLLSACSLGGTAKKSQNKPEKSTTNQTAPSPSASQTPVIPQSLTLTEVAKHATIDDCWMVVNNQVYDLSAYTKAGAHPGGDKILKGCGQEATAMFKAIEKHSGRATNMLPQYLLGALQ